MKLPGILGRMPPMLFVGVIILLIIILVLILLSAGGLQIIGDSPDVCSIPGATDPRCGADPIDRSEKNELPEDCVLEPGKANVCAEPEEEEN